MQTNTVLAIQNQQQLKSFYKYGFLIASLQNGIIEKIKITIA